MKKRYLLITLLLIATNSAFAWDATGHIIVAQIAYNNLTPTAKADVNYLIGNTNFASNFPQFTPYVYSAPWPDYLKYSINPPAGKTMEIFNFLKTETEHWHYDNQAYVIGNYQPQPLTPNNSVWAINYLVSDLKRLIKSKNYSQAAYALVFMTHIVGDLHQPLHNSDMYDSFFPNGDLGGNYYTIQTIYGNSELHSLWDESLGRFNDWPNYSPDAGYRPPLANVQATAQQFQNLCGSVTDQNPADWHHESYLLVVDYVYPFNNPLAPLVNGTVSSQYIMQNRQIAAAQMCLAGKRLASVLNSLFKNPI
ncbi:MAG: S1/P1 nuclease [Coxiellaceae bacterium]|nr:S1/P1 nuclease [Coxiellaceae bacterium]